MLRDASPKPTALNVNVYFPFTGISTSNDAILSSEPLPNKATKPSDVESTVTF